MTAADLLRARYALAVMGQDQIGIFPLIVPAARLVANRFRRGGGRPPQADYPPPRRPLPPPPDRLIPVAQKLINQNQKDEDQDLEGDTTMAGETVMGADGYEYGVDEYGRMVRRIPRRHPPRFQPAADDSDLGFGADEMGADDDDLDDGSDDDVSLDDLSGDNQIDEETGEDCGFGLDIPKATGKLEELKSKAASYQARINELNSKRVVFNKKGRIAKLQKKMGKIKGQVAQLQAQIRQEKAKRRAQRQQAAGTMAAINAAARGGASAQGNQPGGVPFSRGGQTVNKSISAAQGQAIRRGQAMEGLIHANLRSPPGSGRLLAVPMLASGATTNRVSTTIAVANTLQSIGVLTSEDVPYSVYKIVGFTANVRRSATGAGTALQAETGQVFVSNLQIKGGSNLFLHDAAQDAEEYDTDHDHMIGLRSYPIVTSPNKATVTASAIAIAADVVLISNFNLVVDQVSDDVYGSGVPGVYAG